MPESFPQILCRLRKERHLNQRTAAAALHISQALLSHYENGLREPGLSFVDAACRYYDVSADYLLGRSPVRAAFPSEELPAELSEMAESGAAALHSILTGLRSKPEYPTGDLALLLKVFLYETVRPFDRDRDYAIPEWRAYPLCAAARSLLIARLREIGGGDRPRMQLPDDILRDSEAFLAELLEIRKDKDRL